MQTIVPLTQDNQEILVHALVRFGETRNKPDFKNPSFEVIPSTLEVLAVIHLVDVMMGEVYPHLFIKGVDTT